MMSPRFTYGCLFGLLQDGTMSASLLRKIECLHVSKLALMVPASPLFEQC